MIACIIRSYCFCEIFALCVCCGSLMTIDTVAEDQCFENRKKEFRGLKVANCWILNFQKKKFIYFNETPLKMIKNAFSFYLKSSFSSQDI